MTRAPLTIAFHSNQLSVTGTEVALFDYAHYNETLLGHRSVVMYHRHNPNNHADALAKFSNRFEVVAYDHLTELDSALASFQGQMLYAIKAGKRDGVVSQRVPTMVHAVFPTAPRQAHGDDVGHGRNCVRGALSTQPLRDIGIGTPMPDVEDDLRAELNIPDSALVLGCYGGERSFDVPCAVSAAQQLLKDRSDIYFIFLNLAPFLNHPRAIFLPGTTDPARKTRFINTCDAMAHARAQGESFGLACGEFSARNKPVMTYKHCKHTHHHDVLGGKAMLYGSHDEFVHQVGEMNRQKLSQGQWDCYSDRYSPERVMDLFDAHLIQPALRDTGANSVGLKTSLAFIKHKLTSNSMFR